MRNVILWPIAAFVVAFTVLGGCADNGPTNPSDGPGNPAAEEAIAKFYETLPDVDNCYEGILQSAERRKVVDYLNSIRAVHGLPAVSLQSSDDELTAQSALIIAANRSLTHNPNSFMKCYSEKGKVGSSNSNIALSSWYNPTDVRTSESWIDLWINDKDVVSLGHRRWLLDPFLKYVSFNRVDKIPVGNESGVSAAAIKVVNDEVQDLTGTTIEYVAVPYHQYPASAFKEGMVLSFSVLADPNDWFANNNVDYSSATIEMTGPDGIDVPVNSISSSNELAGLGNVLKWLAPIRYSVRYTVRINNVVFNGQSYAYEYWFSLSQPT
jgi:uncharacterized protein YkwD